MTDRTTRPTGPVRTWLADGTIDTDELKSCCAAGYSSDLVALLLGDSYHPGGRPLTRRLLDALSTRPGDRLVDVACGVGATSLLAADEFGLDVDGVDLAVHNLDRARTAAEAAGLAAGFHHGDAESLPLADGLWDVVVCECALCTFPDKPTAIAEMVRVLRPGGRIGITDVTAHHDRLPEILTGLSGWVACVADARPAAEYADLLTASGLRITTVEEHPEALVRTVVQAAARIELLRIYRRAEAEQLGLDFDQVKPVFSAVQDAIEAGTLGYVLIVAEKPA